MPITGHQYGPSKDPSRRSSSWVPARAPAARIRISQRHLPFMAVPPDDSSRESSSSSVASTTLRSSAHPFCDGNRSAWYSAHGGRQHNGFLCMGGGGVHVAIEQAWECSFS